MTFARLTALVFALGAVALALPACGGDGNCSPGEECTCEGSDDECFLSCEGDGCKERCSDSTHCGGVCEGAACSFACHDVQECSAFCGDRCASDCRDAVSCETIAGVDSRVTCQHADRCGAEVGDGSTVTCTDASSCIVLCHGNCVVECDRLGRPCEVHCGSRTGPARFCDGGTTCGC